MIKITHWDIDSTKMTLKDKQRFHEFITQQEKVSKLLGLYQELTDLEPNSYLWYETKNEIKSLERELNE